MTILFLGVAVGLVVIGYRLLRFPDEGLKRVISPQISSENFKLRERSAEPIDLPMDALVHWEGELPRGTEIALLVFKPLALFFPEIKEVMRRNLFKREIIYKYHFLSRAASEEAPKLANALSVSQASLSGKVFFIGSFLETSSALLDQLSVLLVDGVWVARLPDGKLEGFVVSSVDGAPYGRPLGQPVLESLQYLISKGSGDLFPPSGLPVLRQIHHQVNIQININVGLISNGMTPAFLNDRI